MFMYSSMAAAPSSQKQYLCKFLITRLLHTSSVAEPLVSYCIECIASHASKASILHTAPLRIYSSPLRREKTAHNFLQHSELFFRNILYFVVRSFYLQNRYSLMCDLEVIH